MREEAGPGQQYLIFIIAIVRQCVKDFIIIFFFNLRFTTNNNLRARSGCRPSNSYLQFKIPKDLKAGGFFSQN